MCGSKIPCTLIIIDFANGFNTKEMEKGISRIIRSNLKKSLNKTC
jgi:hypothetical protein